MKFDDLDAKMRVFETAHDHCVLPEMFMVARLDGRNFTKLTKETLRLEAPFDPRFRDAMLDTVEHLMTCGFRAAFGFTQSDEISLLLHRDETAFQRKLRKLESVLAGEASAKFSLKFRHLATFDCRISQLPTAGLVRDYFRWRSEDAHRNALNAHCYWMLRKQDHGAEAASKQLLRLSVSRKNELLFQNGINFNDLPDWQKRGMGVYWETYLKSGKNPLTGETVQAERRRLKRDLELPLKDAFDAFLDDLITNTAA